MTQLYIHLLRHGEAEHNTQSYEDVTLFFDAPLTQSGCLGAVQARQKVPERVRHETQKSKKVKALHLVSPLRRTLATARLVLPDVEEWIVHEGLREKAGVKACDERHDDIELLGLSINQHFSDLPPSRFVVEPSNLFAPNGARDPLLEAREPHQALMHRAANFLFYLNKKLDCGEAAQENEDLDVVIVTHSEFINCFFAAIGIYKPNHRWLGNCEWRTCCIPATWLQKFACDSPEHGLVAWQDYCNVSEPAKSLWRNPPEEVIQVRNSIPCQTDGLVSHIEVDVLRAWKPHAGPVSRIPIRYHTVGSLTALTLNLIMLPHGPPVALIPFPPLDDFRPTTAEIITALLRDTVIPAAGFVSRKTLTSPRTSWSGLYGQLPGLTGCQMDGQELYPSNIQSLSLTPRALIRQTLCDGFRFLSSCEVVNNPVVMLALPPAQLLDDLTDTNGGLAKPRGYVFRPDFEETNLPAWANHEYLQSLLDALKVTASFGGCISIDVVFLHDL